MDRGCRWHTGCGDRHPDASLAWLTADPAIDEPGRFLADAYPPSRPAWVSEGPLLVRSGPSLENEYLGMLEAGAGVMVEEYSSDAEWSRLSQPESGWVSNQSLNFLSETEPFATVQLAVRSGYIAEENVAILSGPGPDFTLQDSVPVGTAVVAVAVTTDGQWVLIAEPMAGWLHAGNVQFPGE